MLSACPTCFSVADEVRSSEITETIGEKPGNKGYVTKSRGINSGENRVIPEITYGDHKGNCQV